MRTGAGRRLAALAGMALASFAVGALTTSLTGLVAARVGQLVHDPSELLEVTPLDWRLLPERFLLEWMQWTGSVIAYPFGGDVENWAALAVAGAASIAPVLLIAPALGPWGPSEEGRPLRTAVAGAAIIGGGIALGIVACIGDLASLALSKEGAAQFFLAPMVLVPAWIVLGTAWAALLARAGRARHPDRVDRFVRWLFAGSCVELAIAAPTYALGMRKDDCYCGWASWWAITAGVTALVLLCGPMLVLMATREARMQWMRSVCAECGYPRRGAGSVCAECGAPLAPAGTPRAQ